MPGRMQKKMMPERLPETMPEKVAESMPEKNWKDARYNVRIDAR